MAARAKEVDASFFAAQPLFLKPCSRPTYYAFIEEHFPELKKDYATRFADGDFGTAAYRKELAQRVAGGVPQTWIGGKIIGRTANERCGTCT